MRRLIQVLLACALAMVFMAQAAVAQTPPTLTGEVLNGSAGATPGQGSVAINCSTSPTGTSTVSYTVEGVAIGPYAGPFEESGSYTISGGVVQTFDATFTIDSAIGDVTGTKTLDPTFPANTGSCTSGATVTSAPVGLLATYEATITTASGTFTDRGTASTSVSPAIFFGTDEVASSQEVFQSELAEPEPQEPEPATLTLEPKVDTNDVDTEHCVTATVTDESGNPVPGVTVRFTVTGSVSASGSDTTDADGEATFCYQGPELPGADAIRAFADTDLDESQDPGEPFDTATKVWTLPTSTPLCEAKITQGGRITANNGDRATFGGNAQSDAQANVKGEETYQDHGPAQPQMVKSIRILAITCNEERTQATIFGEATIDGQGTHQFRIDVQDLAEPGKGVDTYRILLDTGYDSGVQTLKGGNVQIH